MLTGTSTKDNGQDTVGIRQSKAKEYSPSKTATDTKENSKTTSNMEKEYSTLLMARNKRALGKKERSSED